MKRRVFRLWDKSVCQPHSRGGFAMSGSPDVKVNWRRAVRLRDHGMYPTDCDLIHLTPWRAREGTAKVLVNNRELVGGWHATAHPHGDGEAGSGSLNVKVGGESVDLFDRARADAIAMLDKAEEALERWNEKDRAHFKKWFGDDSEAARQEMLEKVRKSRAIAEKNDIVSAHGDEYASVFAPASGSDIKMKDKFWDTERTGHDTQGGVVVHEASHFWGSASTDDHQYGRKGCLALAKENPEDARDNADNLEYYCEGL